MGTERWEPREVAFIGIRLECDAPWRCELELERRNHKGNPTGNPTASLGLPGPPGIRVEDASDKLPPLSILLDMLEKVRRFRQLSPLSPVILAESICI